MTEPLSDNAKLLKEISHKLDQLIVLGKLTNRDILEQFGKEIRRDPVSSNILDYADGSLTYSDLSKKVAEETGSAEITVKLRISKLKEMGLLVSRKEGREVYYENLGLIG